MPDVIFSDARDYLFPIFEVTVVDNTFDLSTRRYLGTGFYGSPIGDAITAAHVLPKQSDLGPDRKLIAWVMIDGEEGAAWITKWAVFEAFDVALFSVNLPTTKFFATSDIRIDPGTDLTVVGFPSHQVLGKGIEMRILKGHATAAMPRIELNFPIPAGMSGSPLLKGLTAVGFATGRVRSEEIDEQTEELTTVMAGHERIEIRTTASIIYYGLANTFWMMRDAPDPVLNGMSLAAFIAFRIGANSEHDGQVPRSAPQ